MRAVKLFTTSRATDKEGQTPTPVANIAYAQRVFF
jgi:hypothetical protein